MKHFLNGKKRGLLAMLVFYYSLPRWVVIFTINVSPLILNKVIFVFLFYLLKISYYLSPYLLKIDDNFITNFYLHYLHYYDNLHYF